MAYSVVTVSTAATLIATANPNRIGIIIQNQSTGAVFLGEDSSVTTSSYGLRLGQYETLSEDDGGTKMFCGDIYGIVASSTSDVAVWERTRQS